MPRRHTACPAPDRSRRAGTAARIYYDQGAMARPTCEAGSWRHRPDPPAHPGGHQRARPPCQPRARRSAPLRIVASRAPSPCPWRPPSSPPSPWSPQPWRRRRRRCAPRVPARLRSTWKLTAKPGQRPSSKPEFRGRPNVVGQKWTVTIRDNTVLRHTGTHTTTALSGSFTARSLMPDMAGDDRIVARDEPGDRRICRTGHHPA